MTDYPFDLIKAEKKGPIENNTLLTRRPFKEIDRSFKADARRYVPGKSLERAINTAIAVGDPLLITGEPGTGKTRAAYYAAFKLNIEPALHFQVKSDSTAKDLLYHFDTVRYFHDAHLANSAKKEGDDTVCTELPEKKNYVEARPLWTAFKEAEKTGIPRVLLIDEIDKAPRDFPNDLLHELDQMDFTITETGEKIEAPPEIRPIIFITSNSERRLPEPFLRRCVYHHIRFNDKIVKEAINARKDEFSSLSPEFINLAIRRFLAVRDRNLRKKPATGELLVWLRVLALNAGNDTGYLQENLADLPHVGVLLKDHKDIEEMKAG